MLQAGMTLVNRDNEQTLKVVSQTKLDKTDTVYNFEADEFHTYHIGEFGVWVHNSFFENALNLRFSNPNNVHHFIHGSKTSNHHWDLLVPDFNENDIKKIALEVLEQGRSVPYKPGVDYLKQQGYSDTERSVILLGFSAIIGATVGGDTASTVTGYNQTDNNYLNHTQLQSWVEELENCGKANAGCIRNVNAKYQSMDRIQAEDLHNSCVENFNLAQCKETIEHFNDNFPSANIADPLYSRIDTISGSPVTATVSRNNASAIDARDRGMVSILRAEGRNLAAEILEGGSGGRGVSRPSSPKGGTSQGSGNYTQTVEAYDGSGAESENEKLASLKAPATRHIANKVTQKSRAKTNNTVINTNVVNVHNDVVAIRNGEAEMIDNTFHINNRVYGLHGNALYPISGEGIYPLDRGAYGALGVYNKFGNTPTAVNILDNMGTDSNTRDKALEVYGAIND